MTARVVDTDVESIIDVDSSLDVDIFIGMAHLLTDNVLSASGLSEDTLTEIERLLAAHFITVKYPQTKSEQIGDVRKSFVGDALGTVGLGLKGSTYGQAAMTMDTSGLLKRENAPKGGGTVIFKAL